MTRKILIIDDNRDIVQLEKNRLEANHYEIITATDGVEGMVYARTLKPDLILLDIIMPNLDGYTLYRQLKNDPDTKSIPVIVATTRSQIKQMFKVEGFDEEFFLAKPFSMDELLGKIEKIFNVTK